MQMDVVACFCMDTATARPMPPRPRGKLLQQPADVTAVLAQWNKHRHMHKLTWSFYGTAVHG